MKIENEEENSDLGDEHDYIDNNSEIEYRFSR